MTDAEHDSRFASLPLTPLVETPRIDLLDARASDHESDTPDLICRYLPDTTLTYVNDAYCNRFGPRESLLGRRFLDLLPPSIKEQARQHVESILAHPRIETWEHEVIHPDGSIGWQGWLDFVIVDRSGEVVELQGIGRDITERKRHEQSLAAQQSISRILASDHDLKYVVPQVLLTIASWLGFAFAALWIEIGGDRALGCAGICDVAAIGSTELASETNLATFASGDGLPGRVWMNHHMLWRPNLASDRDFRRPSALAAGLSAGLWHPVRGGGRTIGVLELLGRGSPKPDRATLRVLQAVCLHVGQYIERVRAQEALRNREARFRALIQHASEGVLIVDADGVIRYASDSAGTILGVTAKELSGMKGFDLVHPDDLLAAQTFLSDALRQGSEGSLVEVRARCGDDSWCLIQVRATDLRGEPSIDGVVINFRDVSEQRASELAIRQLSGRILQLQDEERRRIARDLHDGTAQHLLALRINLEQMRRLSARGEATERLMNESDALIETASREIRTLSYVLHPPLLDEAGLVAALRWFVDGFANRSGIAVDLIEESEIGRLPLDVEIALFRVVQESLTNVHRHSGSRTANIVIGRDRFGVRLEVTDQGGHVTGSRPNPTLSLNTSVESLGVGIAGMKERLRQFGGSVSVSRSEQGTTVAAQVPSEGLPA